METTTAEDGEARTRNELQNDIGGIRMDVGDDGRLKDNTRLKRADRLLLLYKRLGMWGEQVQWPQKVPLSPEFS